MAFHKRVRIEGRKLTIKMPEADWRRLDAAREWADREELEFALEEALVGRIMELVAAAEKQQRQLVRVGGADTPGA